MCPPYSVTIGRLGRTVEVRPNGGIATALAYLIGSELDSAAFKARDSKARHRSTKYGSSSGSLKWFRDTQSGW